MLVGCRRRRPPPPRPAQPPPLTSTVPRRKPAAIQTMLTGHHHPSSASYQLECYLRAAEQQGLCTTIASRHRPPLATIAHPQPSSSMLHHYPPPSCGLQRLTAPPPPARLPLPPPMPSTAPPQPTLQSVGSSYLQQLDRYETLLSECMEECSLKGDTPAAPPEASPITQDGLQCVSEETALHEVDEPMDAAAKSPLERAGEMRKKLAAMRQRQRSATGTSP